MQPASSGKIRSSATLRAVHRTCVSPSPSPAPSSTSSPRPIAPVARSSTSTRARRTRCTTARIPFDRDLAFLRHAVVESVGAVRAVDRDATTLRDHADHAIAGHRLAAAGEAEHDVIEALDAHAGALLAEAERLERSLRETLG